VVCDCCGLYPSLLPTASPPQSQCLVSYDEEKPGFAKLKNME
jgi:hypothetical protein